MKLDLYEANADYIAYLRQFDPNVLTDKTYKQKKFVGTIVTINSKQYFAPLSSPKGKHRLLDSKLTNFDPNFNRDVFRDKSKDAYFGYFLGKPMHQLIEWVEEDRNF